MKGDVIQGCKPQTNSSFEGHLEAAIVLVGVSTVLLAFYSM